MGFSASIPSDLSLPAFHQNDSLTQQGTDESAKIQIHIHWQLSSLNPVFKLRTLLSIPYVYQSTWNISKILHK